MTKKRFLAGKKREKAFSHFSDHHHQDFFAYEQKALSSGRESSRERQKERLINHTHENLTPSSLEKQL